MFSFVVGKLPSRNKAGLKTFQTVGTTLRTLTSQFLHNLSFYIGCKIYFPFGIGAGFGIGIGFLVNFCSLKTKENERIEKGKNEGRSVLPKEK